MFNLKGMLNLAVCFSNAIICVIFMHKILHCLYFTRFEMFNVLSLVVIDVILQYFEFY